MVVCEIGNEDETPQLVGLLKLAHVEGFLQCFLTPIEKTSKSILHRFPRGFFRTGVEDLVAGLTAAAGLVPAGAGSA